MKVYLAISEVQAKLAKDGISKSRENKQQGYQFRGIDDVYNALSSLLAESKLCILPTVLEREVVERISKSGTALFYVTVKVRYDFVSAEDGSKHEVVTYGEAMDSGDKATNKAMSAAYKYAAMQAFCIPTEGDNDADATTHEVAAKIVPESIPARKGARDALSPEELAKVDETAVAMLVWLNEGAVEDAVLVGENAGLSTEQKVALWDQFNSKQRSAMVKANTAMRARAKAAELATQG